MIYVEGNNLSILNLTAGNEANGEDQSPSDYPEESIIRLNVDEEHDYLNDDWAEVVSGQQNWDNGIDPECYVTAAIPHYLTSRTNDDDTSTPGFNVNVFDLDTSSTGSTGDVNVTVIGNTCWNPINVPMTENSDRGTNFSPHTYERENDGSLFKFLNFILKAKHQRPRPKQ